MVRLGNGMTAYWQTVRLFNRNVLLYFGVAALLGFTIDGGIYSVIFNLYLLRLGHGPEFVGQVNSAGMLIFALGSLPLGMLGGRFGNRRMLIIGMALMSLGCLLLPLGEFMPLAWQEFWLFLAYMLTNVGMAHFYANGPPYIMHITRPDERNHVFSIQSAFWSLAAFAGSLLAGFLPAYFAFALGNSLAEPAPYRFPLLFAGIMLIPALWAVLQMRPDHGQLGASTDDVVSPNRNTPWLMYGLIALMALVRLLQVAGAGVVGTFFNVYMDAGLHVSTAQIGLIVATGRFMAVIAALSTPVLAARWGTAQLAIWASFAVALALLPLAYVPVWSAAGLGYIGATAFTSIRYPAFLLHIMELTPARYRSAMSGAGETAAGLSFALMALIGGYLIAQQGYQNLFLLGAAETTLGTLILWGYLQVKRVR